MNASAAGLFCAGCSAALAHGSDNAAALLYNSAADAGKRGAPAGDVDKDS